MELLRDLGHTIFEMLPFGRGDEKGDPLRVRSQGSPDHPFSHPLGAQPGPVALKGKITGLRPSSSILFAPTHSPPPCLLFATLFSLPSPTLPRKLCLGCPAEPEES